jgi:uncharacterized Zn finger protein
MYLKKYGALQFLKCHNCGQFHWVDIPANKQENIATSSQTTKATTSSSNNQQHQPIVKVIVEENGKKITYEGQVDDIA